MTGIIKIKDLDLLETVADDDEIAVQRKADGVVYKAEKSTLKGDKGDTGDAATVDAGATTTGAAGTDANVVNSGTTSAAVFDFTIPRGDKGETGDTGATGPQGPAGDDAYVYIAYASDDQGTDFTLTFNPTLNYIAILSTDTEIPSPVVADFTGLWKELAFNQNVFNFQRIAQTGTSPYEALGGAVNGTNTVFTVPDAKYITGTLQVYLNGKLVIPNVGWTETTPASGTFTFEDAPITGDIVTVVFQDTEITEGSVVTEPAGVDGQIQFNDDGAFGGARLVYGASGNNSTISHSAPGAISYTGNTIRMADTDFNSYIEVGNGYMAFENSPFGGFEMDTNNFRIFAVGGGASATFEVAGGENYRFWSGAGSFYGNFDFTNIATSNKTFTFPNVSGGVAVDSIDNEFTTGQTITVPDAANVLGLTINQNDVTNNPNGLNIVNAGTGDELTLENTNAGDQGVVLNLYHNSASPADFDFQDILFNFNNSSATKTLFAYFDVFAQDVTAGTEGGSLNIGVKRAGVNRTMLGIGVDDAFDLINGVQIGDGLSAAVLKSGGEQDLILRTGNVTTGRILITDGANGNISIEPDGTGALVADTDTIRLTTPKTPASATAAGTAGDITWDTDYIYVCTATNTWKRSALTTW